MKKHSAYISEIDQLLAELRQKTPESSQQSKERLQYEKLNTKRDKAVVEEKEII